MPLGRLTVRAQSEPSPPVSHDVLETNLYTIVKASLYMRNRGSDTDRAWLLNIMKSLYLEIIDMCPRSAFLLATSVSPARHRGCFLMTSFAILFQITHRRNHETREARRNKLNLCLFRRQSITVTKTFFFFFYPSFIYFFFLFLLFSTPIRN